jgi:hypothetical protein
MKPAELEPEEETAGVLDSLKAAEDIVGRKWYHKGVELRVAIMGTFMTDSWASQLPFLVDPDLQVKEYSGVGITVAFENPMMETFELFAQA